MTRLRTTVACCLLAVAAAGCGIRPSGVTDGGTAPSGISQGMRVYFASDNGPRGVSRPDARFSELNAAFKLLLAGPTPEERAAGLANVLTRDQAFSATSRHGNVTINAPGYASASPQDQGTGQLVCTVARAEVLLHGTRPDKVQVTVVGAYGRAGPYQCQQFLSR